MAERLRAPDSSSGVADQRSLGSSVGCGTCVLEQDINFTIVAVKKGMCKPQHDSDLGRLERERELL